MPSKKATAKEIYQLKITLKGSQPPIWRRVQVPADITLAELHDVIQSVMGWTDSHLHAFSIGQTQYGSVDPEFGLDDAEDEEVAVLNQVVQRPKSKFTYEYDFGDSWEHELVLEKILPPEPGARYPRCLDGARHGPPEDCGGIWGYAELLEAIQDPEHDSHEEMLEWVGGDFDPEVFDLESINRRLR